MSLLLVFCSNEAQHLKHKRQTDGTLLAAAAERVNESMVRILVEFIARIEGSDDGPNQAIHAAMKAEHIVYGITQ